MECKKTLIVLAVLFVVLLIVYIINKKKKQESSDETKEDYVNSIYDLHTPGYRSGSHFNMNRFTNQARQPYDYGHYDNFYNNNAANRGFYSAFIPKGNYLFGPSHNYDGFCPDCNGYGCENCRANAVAFQRYGLNRRFPRGIDGLNGLAYDTNFQKVGILTSSTSPEILGLYARPFDYDRDIWIYEIEDEKGNIIPFRESSYWIEDKAELTEVIGKQGSWKLNLYSGRRAGW